MICTPSAEGGPGTIATAKTQFLTGIKQPELLQNKSQMFYTHPHESLH